ncbi:hypothetical protein ACUN3E_37955 [Streptomyces sp. Ju416(a)]|uniref:hypothetical protein n=1 Tax=Streptomyces sp. Ju416(a) TaxID=3446591 RepID=UPI00403D6F76
MNEQIPDAEEQPPWTEADGPEPDIHIYPRETAPGLYIRHDGRWLRATVTSRQTHPDRGVSYTVDITFSSGSGSIRTYQWGQPGVRKGWEPGAGLPPTD